MWRQSFPTLIAIAGALSIMTHEHRATDQQSRQPSENVIRLPKPERTGTMTLEQAIRERRSVREYKAGEGLALDELSQLLWAAQGITSEEGLRTAPSAGATFPIEVYVLAGNVRNLQPGIYHFRPHSHDLVSVVEGDKRQELGRAAIGQEQVPSASAVIVLSAVFERTTGKYFERGRRYVYFEAGHVSQNVLLQAVALGLGAVPVGAFSDSEVKNVMHLRNGEDPLYLIPVGRK